MRARPGILLVSASAGNGHARAAEALRQALAEAEPQVRVEHVDVLALTRGWVRSAYGGGCEFLASRAPWIWRELYRLTDGPRGDAPRWGAVVERLLFRELKRLLATGDWRLCLCTHFLPAQLVAGRAGLPPFALVVTDFVLHRYWMQARVGRFFVATDALADEVRRRMPRATVDAAGIPVSPAFAAAPSRGRARAVLGIEPGRPVTLVMGGGAGIGVEESATAALRARVPGMRVIAVCGRNDGARRRLAAHAESDRRLQPLGFTGGIERLIAAADVVVSKPGGLTSSETLAVGRPLVFTRPIPGQEEGNSRAISAGGAALDAHTPERLADTLESVFGQPHLLEQLTAAARRMGRPNAAADIARAALHEFLAAAAA